MPHYITIMPLGEEWQITCSKGDLNKRCSSRNISFMVAHLHVLKIGAEQLELASAGKVDHD